VDWFQVYTIRRQELGVAVQDGVELGVVDLEVGWSDTNIRSDQLCTSQPEPHVLAEYIAVCHQLVVRLDTNHRRDRGKRPVQDTHHQGIAHKQKWYTQ